MAGNPTTRRDAAAEAAAAINPLPEHPQAVNLHWAAYLIQVVSPQPVGR